MIFAIAALTTAVVSIIAAFSIFSHQSSDGAMCGKWKRKGKRKLSPCREKRAGYFLPAFGSEVHALGDPACAFLPTNYHWLTSYGDLPINTI
jgi:hypothetical protein